MDDCAKIRELLALPRADWSAEETRRVEAHLATCEACAATARAYAAQDRWSRSQPPVELTPAQRAQLLSRATAWDRRAPARPRDRQVSTRLGIASRLLVSTAALALLAFLAFGLAALFRQQAQRQTITGIGEGTPPAATEAPATSSPLAGTEWLLTTLDGRPPLAGTHVTLVFQTAQLGGFAGCNSYGSGPDSGAYSATTDGKLTIGDLAMTAMACVEPEGVMDQETAYLQALHSTATYRVIDARLELADSSGQTILVYARQPEYQGDPAALPGTAWRLVSLDGQSPIAGSTITLAFQNGSQAGGHAGCRDYVATYQAVDGDLGFPSTKMIGDVCADQALLEQEGQYTTILGWTRHYRLAAGQLELFSARGEILTFEPLPTPAPTSAASPAIGDMGRLAWIQDGDLWVRGLPDGQPVRLMDDGRNSEPRWSPSGEWLAFRKDAQVWLIRADGGDAYPLDGGGVIDIFAWSPTSSTGGDRLAYTSGSGILRLEVLRAGETEASLLLPPNTDGQPGRIAWNPDGTWIAYEWRQGMDYQGLWQVPANGGQPVELYNSGIPQRGEALLAGWTADGQYLLFWQGDMLSASLLADGAPFYALPPGGQPVLLAGGDGAVLYYDDFWSNSPLGSYLALTVGSGRETWTHKRIALADAATGQLDIRTNESVAASSPAFSPGGAQMAYVAAPEAGTVSGGDPAREALFQRHIWVLGDDALSSSGGPLLHQVTDDPAYRDEHPRWSASGSNLLFVRLDRQDQASLWLLPGREDTVRQVATDLGPQPQPASGWFGTYGHVDWAALYDWWSGPPSVQPGPAAVTSPTATPPIPASPSPGVAALLQNPPAPGETVELDAYFSGAGSALMRPGPPPLPDQVSCPTNLGWATALTDRPFLADLQLLNGLRGNILPPDAAWLVATTPEATQPGRLVQLQLPYLGRLRGHLGDPAFSQCVNADRIFVVEKIVSVYQEQPPASATGPAWTPPADYATWPRYQDAGLGYSLPYPPDWTVTPLAEPAAVSAIAVQDPGLPAFALTVRIHGGETHYDQYDPTSLPPLLQGIGFGVYEQGWAFGQPVEGSQVLSGFAVERGTGEEAVLFSGSGYTFELDMTYPTGFDASQSLLTAYTAMVEGFRLATAPGPTPTPPVKDTLGPGPFLTEEEALDRVRARDGQDIELWDAALLSEASARHQAGACNTFFGHPDGVWLLTVRGTYEGMTRTLDLYLDATSGEQLCGEEIAPPGAGEGQTRLRVTNNSAYTLDRVVVIFPGERIAFGPLAPGETSAYHAVRDGVYAYAAYSITLDGEVIDQPVVDWVGEQPLPGESFTYVLSVDPAGPAMQKIQAQARQD